MRPRVPPEVLALRRPDRSIENGVPLSGLEPLEASLRVSRSPRGLEGESGRTLGTLQLDLSRGAPHDLVFALRSVPEGAVLFDDPPELRVPGGRAFALYNFAAAREGRCRVELTLLDAARQPTANVLVVDLEVLSVGRLSQPQLAARFGPPEALGPGHQGGHHTSATGLPGLYLGPVQVGRTGFADYERLETVLQVEVDDPQGILEPLPPVVTIPRGKQFNVDRPRVVLRPREGSARIRLRHGDQVLELKVTSEPPVWSVPPELEVRRGRSASLHVQIFQVPRYMDEVRCVSSDPAVVRALDDSVSVDPGQPRVVVPLQALSQGEAVLQVRLKGLAPREVRVRVVDE